MAYTRIKGIKNHTGNMYYYAYLVESKWIPELKQPRQKVLKYIGAVVSLKPIRKEVQYRLFSESPQCKICNATERLSIDHITPLCDGGTNDYDNLQVLCVKCNQKKSDSGKISLDDFEAAIGY